MHKTKDSLRRQNYLHAFASESTTFKDASGLSKRVVLVSGVFEFLGEFLGVFG